MYLLDGDVISSASDLSAVSTCEFAFVRALDVRLGRISGIDIAPDAMVERTGRLGDAHELAVLEALKKEHGAGVVEIARPDIRDPEALHAAVALTTQAFSDGVDVVFQATFFDGAFVGFADFIVRTEDGRYQVQDTKLARSVKVIALLQLAAYYEQLERLGVPLADTVCLLLGDGSASEHEIRDILPVNRHRRARLDAVIGARMSAADAAEWGDPRYAICGSCPTCLAEIAAHRDVLLVAGLRLTQRAKLAAAGIRTIEQLAEHRSPVPDLSDSTLVALQRQAAMQLASTAEKPSWQLVNAGKLRTIRLRMRATSSSTSKGTRCIRRRP